MVTLLSSITESGFDDFDWRDGVGSFRRIARVNVFGDAHDDRDSGALRATPADVCGAMCSVGRGGDLGGLSVAMWQGIFVRMCNVCV